MKSAQRQRKTPVTERWTSVKFALGAEIQRVLRVSGVSQKDFAYALNLEPQTLRRLIAATASPRTLDAADASLRASELRGHADTLGLGATHAYVLRGQLVGQQPAWLSRVLERGIQSGRVEEVERQINRGDRNIEFEVVIQGAGVDLNRMRCQQSGHVFTPAHEVASDLWRTFYGLQEEAFRAGHEAFYFKPLARLSRWPEAPYHVLSVDKAFYGLFAVTNLDELYRRKSLEQYRLRRQDLNPSYFANPLNVIGVLITSDGFTFLPLRAGTFEGGGRRQASVGGAVSFTKNPFAVESPVQTFRREVQEELNINISGVELECLAMGMNLRTGEPDILVLAHITQTADELHAAFLGRQQPYELEGLGAPIDFRRGELAGIVKELKTIDLNGPADEAAVFLALCKLRTPEEVVAAFSALS